jgi:hypothetical protein
MLDPHGPVHVTTAKAGASCQRSGLHLICTRDSLPPADDHSDAGTIAVTIQLVPHATGAFSTTAQVRARTPDPHPSNNVLSVATVMH